jgi:uncharacterized protein
VTRPDGSIDAGSFAAWRDEVVRALTSPDAPEVDVPCGDCTACCSSSMFVHIGADESEALAHIPAQLLVAAPGAPAGSKVMGYDEHGRCPMLGEHGCTIYEHRPRTCRTFDCRVFAATGVPVEGADKVLIAERVAKWRFRIDSDDDREARARVVAAVELLRGEALDGVRLALAAVETSAR